MWDYPANTMSQAQGRGAGLRPREIIGATVSLTERAGACQENPFKTRLAASTCKLTPALPGPRRRRAGRRLRSIPRPHTRRRPPTVCPMLWPPNRAVICQASGWREPKDGMPQRRSRSEVVHAPGSTNPVGDASSPSVGRNVLRRRPAGRLLRAVNLAPLPADRSRR